MEINGNDVAQKKRQSAAILPSLKDGANHRDENDCDEDDNQNHHESEVNETADEPQDCAKKSK